MKKYAILSYEPTERIAYFSKMNFLFKRFGSISQLKGQSTLI